MLELMIDGAAFGVRAFAATGAFLILWVAVLCVIAIIGWLGGREEK